MKRIFALILALLMLMTVFVSCGDGTSDNNNSDGAENNDADGMPSLLAGYGRADWTPDFEVTLLGDGTVRRTSKVYSKVYASCTAFRDEAGNTALIYTIDLHSIYGGIVSALRGEIKRATGVPIKNIILSATHSHYTPNPNQPSNLPEIYALLEEACINAAKDAIADLAPCKVYTSTVATEGLSFSRRFVDRNDNGRYEPQTKGEYEADIDRDLQVIKLQREDKKDIILANFSAHATITGVDQISADFIGTCREEFEKNNPDTYFSLYVGASGEVIAKEWVETKGSGIRGDGLTWDPNFIGVEEYGKVLSNYVETALEKASLLESSRGIEVLSKSYSAKVDHSQDDLFSVATRISFANDAGDTAKVKELCKESGIKNASEANAIIQRYGKTAAESLPLTTITVGELAFASAPYEMFSSNGKAVKEGSPYKMTFMLTCSNGHFCYIPNDLAFETGGYEVNTNYYVRGTAETLQNEFINMLNELYSN